MIAKTEPQAAYSCFITAFKHKPSYIMRAISNWCTKDQGKN